MADIRLAKPAAGATETVPCEPSARFVLDFPAADATLVRDGDDLNITFADGSALKLQDFYQEYAEDTLPSFSVDGTDVAAADFFAAMNEPDLMPAAGPAASPNPAGARFHEWGDSSLTGGIEHLNGLDWGFSRSFEWEGVPNAVGYNDDDDEGALLFAQAAAAAEPTIVTPPSPAPSLPEPVNGDEGSPEGLLPTDLTVNEKDLASNGAQAQGLLKIDMENGVSTIEIDGILVYGNDIPGEEVEIPVTIDGIDGKLANFQFDPNNGNLTYTFILDRATQKHMEQDRDSIEFHYEVTVSSLDGTKTAAAIGITIVDDVPEVAATLTNAEFGNNEFANNFNYSGIVDFRQSWDKINNRPFGDAENGYTIDLGSYDKNGDSWNTVFTDEIVNPGLEGVTIRGVKVGYSTISQGTSGTVEVGEHSLFQTVWGYDTPWATNITGLGDVWDLNEWKNEDGYFQSFITDDKSQVIVIQQEGNFLHWECKNVDGTPLDPEHMRRFTMIATSKTTKNDTNGEYFDTYLKINGEVYVTENGFPVIETCEGIPLQWSSHCAADAPWGNNVNGSGLTCNVNVWGNSSPTEFFCDPNDIGTAYGIEITLPNGQTAYGMEIGLGCFFSTNSQSSDLLAEKALCTFYKGDTVVHQKILSSDEKTGDWSGGRFDDGTAILVAGGFDRVIISAMDNGGWRQDPSDFSLRYFNFMTQPDICFGRIEGVVAHDPGADGFAAAYSVIPCAFDAEYAAQHPMVTYSVSGADHNAGACEWRLTIDGNSQVLQLLETGQGNDRCLLWATLNHADDAQSSWVVEIFAENLKIDGQDSIALRFVTKDADGDVGMDTVMVPINESAHVQGIEDLSGALFAETHMDMVPVENATTEEDGDSEALLNAEMPVRLFAAPGLHDMDGTPDDSLPPVTVADGFGIGDAEEGLIQYDPTDYLIDGGSGIDILLAYESTPHSLDAMLKNYDSKGENAKDMPMVHDIEVMIKGVDTSLQNMEDLSREYGLTVKTGEDGRPLLELNKGNWERIDTDATAANTTSYRFLTNDGKETDITLETTLQSDPVSSEEHIVLAAANAISDGNA